MPVDMRLSISQAQGVISKPLFSKCLCFKASSTNHIGFRSLLSGLSKRASETGEQLGDRGAAGKVFRELHLLSTLDSHSQQSGCSVSQSQTTTLQSQSYFRTFQACFNGAKYSRRNFSRAHANLFLVWQPCDM